MFYDSEFNNMTDPKLFQITDEDKVHYHELIDKIDPKSKNEVIKFLGIKIQVMLDDGKLNAVEVELIEGMGKLVEILELHTDLPELVIKKVLFAMSYFIDENDEIPDIIPDYGYLDDVTVVSWIMEDIQGQIPKMPNA